MTPAAKKTPVDDDDPVLIAKQSFSTDLDGVPTAINAGVTRVRASHPLARKYPEHFVPVDQGLSYETATRAPGERRGEQA
jgi:hypothetical protein